MNKKVVMPTLGIFHASGYETKRQKAKQQQQRRGVEDPR
jgi:hypothetical protein